MPKASGAVAGSRFEDRLTEVPKHPVKTQKETERAVLGAVERKGKPFDQELQELQELVLTAGAETVAIITQKRDNPSPSTYLGTGKVEEIKEAAIAEHADVVIVDDELTPVQQRNLGELLEKRVLDRTQLILDIFAQRARTSEGKLQVELAQLNYLLPRLSRLYTKFERQQGGIGMRGPGETKLEADRRRVRERISELTSQVNEVRRHRQVQRASRERDGFPTAALVGYTSAGKSTLLNALAGSDVYVDPKLFATLDPTTRRTALPGGRPLLISDTVGFIRRLPHKLVAAFRATLEETVQADVLIHVVDASSPEMEGQMEAVIDVLTELHIQDKPIVTVLNKIDLVKDTFALREMVANHPDTVYISALTGDGLKQLLLTVERVLAHAERRKRQDADDARQQEAEQRRALRTL
ncbi:MAG: GTP-binding protein HSR1-related protein [Armatimonadetes bacterium]|nr:GTP-binding protein HSR1-related protein [Armatimonadota bacterium]